MSGNATCAACGTEGTRGGTIRFLADPGSGEDPEDILHLCEGCLADRSAKIWHTQEKKGRQLQEELDSHTSGTSGRYSFLEEPGQRIHLLRLRPGWIDAKRGS